MTAKRPAPQGDSYVSVFVATGTSGSHKETNGRTLTLLEVVDTVPMETKMVTVEADAMAKDIAATGHVALYGIYFDHDKADLKPESAPTISEIVKLLKQDPKLTIRGRPHGQRRRLRIQHGPVGAARRRRREGTDGQARHPAGPAQGRRRRAAGASRPER